MTRPSGAGAEQVQGFLAGVSAAPVRPDSYPSQDQPRLMPTGAARPGSCPPCGLGRCRALKVFRAARTVRELCGGDNADGS
jgi:hypothetical protein